ncbi:hypothetical protein CAPGI0001_0806 [Capnocytophaga gingivalis ATCC 33624]|nr:hypothetical protein CAPGI0001_0806 [Capnocytophaga gingivalis ATCC 33624]
MSFFIKEAAHKGSLFLIKLFSLFFFGDSSEKLYFCLSLKPYY